MAVQENLMTNVLYGGPYYKKSGFYYSEKETIYAINFENYEKAFGTPFLDEIDKKGMKNKAVWVSKKNQIQKVIDATKKRTFSFLGVEENNEEDLNKAIEIYKWDSEFEEALYDWIDEVIKFAEQDAIARGKNENKSFYENKFDDYMDKAQDKLDKLTTKIKGITKNGITDKQLKELFRNLFFSEGLPIVSTNISSNTGISGEIGTAISSAIKTLIHSEIDLSIDDICTEIVGTLHGKLDVKTIIKNKDKEIIRVLTFSAKRKSPTLNKIGKKTFFDLDKVQNIKVDSPGKLTTFFENISKSFGNELNIKELADGFNTYWFNLLYFSRYEGSSKEANRKIQKIRTRIYNFLSTYAFIFLMTGRNTMGEKEDFFSSILNSINNSDNTTLLYSISGIDVIPMYKVLQSILNGLDNNKSSINLTFSLSGIADSIEKVDEFQSKKGTIKPNRENIMSQDKNGNFSMNGKFYRRTQGLENTPAKDVLNERYNIFSKDLSVAIFLKLQRGALNFENLNNVTQ